MFNKHQINLIVFNCFFVLLTFFSINQHAQTIVLEAESFSDKGDWVIDQQSTDQIGSSYLLAHGLGIPCIDAQTQVEFPDTGTYNIWVRTRNWAPAQNKEQSAGRFLVSVNGNHLDTIFGMGIAPWHWHYGGKSRIEKKMNEISLHDLTGFEGRCDAIIFSKDENLIQHNETDPLIDIRNKIDGKSSTIEEVQQFDLVVVGGGIAGISTSIAAARLGAKVALIHNRPVLGGNNSAEVRVRMSSDLNIEPYPQLGNITAEIDSLNVASRQPAFVGIQNDDHKLMLIKKEPNISLFLENHVLKANMENNAIKSVVARHISTGKQIIIQGKYFADCTGDGNLGYLAGANYHYGRESKVETNEELAPEKPDSLVLGATLFWRSEKKEHPVDFPDCPWALQFNDSSCQNKYRGSWNWETGFYDDMVFDTEQIRDNMFRAIYGNWAYQKNDSDFKDKYAMHKLLWVGYILGKRESRRLMGDLVYSQNDIESSTYYKDACVPTKWGIDIHYPHPENEKYFGKNAFRSTTIHKDTNKHPTRSLPYRCLYSNNIKNMFMAGRCVSMTHIAHGMFRCQHTTGMMGEVVGMAASLCVKYEASPRNIYEKYWDEMQQLLEKGL